MPENESPDLEHDEHVDTDDEKIAADLAAKNERPLTAAEKASVDKIPDAKPIAEVVERVMEGINSGRSRPSNEGR